MPPEAAASQQDAGHAAASPTDGIDAAGRVEATRLVDLHAPITGWIQGCSAREGDAVSAGQVLLRILPTETDAAEHPIQAPWDGVIARAHVRVECAEPVLAAPLAAAT